MSPLVQFPDSAVVLAPRLLPDAAYYAALSRYGRAVVDTSLRHDRRCKAVHRYAVADVRGRLELTVPVGRPAHDGDRPTLWSDVPVSDHGQWWHVHRVTLESAYGRTPYFEFLIDKFDGIICPPGTPPPSALELAARADAVVRSILGIDTPVEWRPAAPGETFDADFRRNMPVAHELPPYFQVRQASLGFIAPLSILDLIFNLGPEAPLYLRSLTFD